MVTRRAILATLTALVAGPKPSVAATPPRWEKRTVPVLDFTSAPMDGYIARVVADWNDALGQAGARLRLRFVPMERRDECAGVQRTKRAITVCNMTQHPEYAAGITDLRIDGKRIVSTKTTLVAKRYDTNSGESGYWWHPMGCHELGHALGLDHPDDWGADTCMGVQYDRPGAVDIANLRRLYRGKR